MFVFESLLLEMAYIGFAISGVILAFYLFKERTKMKIFYKLIKKEKMLSHREIEIDDLR